MRFALSLGERQPSTGAFMVRLALSKLFLVALAQMAFFPASAEASKRFQPGDAVIVKGHFGNDCSGRVKEIARPGFAAVELDSFLCADTRSPVSFRKLRKAEFSDTAETENRSFSIGQRVAVEGIHEGDLCQGKILRLTSAGLAEIRFDEQTCAYSGKLYPLDSLKEPRAPKPRLTSGVLIFERVMREIRPRRSRAEALEMLSKFKRL